MKLLVTAIDIDFEGTDTDYRAKLDEQIDIENDCLGVWELDSEEDLDTIIRDDSIITNAISDEIGWCVNSVDYEIQLKGDFI